MKEKEYYLEQIVEMIQKIDNNNVLKLIYGFTKSGYKEEKARK